MTYWHMQLHPDDKSWGREKELLENKALIGLGDWEGGQSQIYQFKNEMERGDIVLIKCGANPIALVKVIGNIEDIKDNDFSKIDWFQFRRKVEILDFYTKPIADFPYPRGTLKKSINKYTLTYQYIDDWYKRTQNMKESKGLKLKSLKIGHYKIFEDFTINFTDKENNLLDVVVIAGKNGTGKTSIFEYLTNLDSDARYNISYELDGKKYDTLHNDLLIGTTKIADNITLFLENIIFVPARTPNEDEIKSLNKLILDYIDYFIYDQSLTAAVGYENLQTDIEEIFEDFGLSFQFKKIDSKDKKALFEPHDSSRDDIEFKLEQLSTGEKTLLFKIFNLYLQQAKNKVILIDEPELSLHPHWQNRVLQVYEKFAKINNNQIIIATHSPHIIASAKKEYIKVLRKNAYGQIDVIDNFSKSYGLEFSKVLLEIMGMDETRTPEVEKELKYVKEQIYSNKFINNDKFQNRWNDLQRTLGKNDLDLKLLQLEMNMREKKNVSNN